MSCVILSLISAEVTKMKFDIPNTLYLVLMILNKLINIALGVLVWQLDGTVIDVDCNIH